MGASVGIVFPCYYARPLCGDGVVCLLWGLSGPTFCGWEREGHFSQKVKLYVRSLGSYQTAAHAPSCTGLRNLHYVAASINVALPTLAASLPASCLSKV